MSDSEGTKELSGIARSVDALFSSSNAASTGVVAAAPHAAVPETADPSADVLETAAPSADVPEPVAP
ncbi:MAG: hypothetical protein HKO77_06420, partial [Gemmatimonadetes bacterium]|nr:hypothetical protein [Gemmatimonadota bacterium]